MWEFPAEPGLTELQLEDSGDFVVSGTRCPQAAEVLIHCGRSLAISKAAGAGEPLHVTDLTTGRRSYYRFRVERWERQSFLLPLSEPIIDDVLLFLPGCLHVLPTWHHFFPGEAIDVAVSVPPGSYSLRREVGTDALLEVHSPLGTVRRYQAHGEAWFEVFSTWSDLRRPADTLSLPKAQLSFEKARSEEMGKCWTRLGELGSPATMCPSGAISHLDFPYLQFHDNGGIQVQNHYYAPGELIALHFLTWFIWRDGESVVVRRLPAASELADQADGQDTVFRYRAGRWEQRVDKLALSWWQRHGGHVLMLALALSCLIVAMTLFELVFTVFPIVPWLLDFLLP